MLEGRIERDGHDLTGRVAVLLGDGPAQRLANNLGQRVGVLGLRGVFRQRFENRRQFPHGNAALEQVLQDPLEQGDGDVAVGADDLSDERRLVFAETVHEQLHVFAGQQLIGVSLERLGQMGDEDRLRIDDGVAVQFGGFLLAGRDPDGGQSVNRFGCLDALDLFADAAGVHGQEHLRLQPALGHRDLREADLVGVRFEVQIVAQAHQGDDDPQVLGELPAQGADPLEDRVALPWVHQRDQAHADVDGDPIHVQQLLDRFLLGLLGGCFRRRQRLLLGPEGGPPDQSDGAAQEQELDLGHAGNEGHRADDAGRRQKRLAGLEELPGDVLADAVAGGDLRDKEARADRDDQ